jgi:transposase
VRQALQGRVRAVHQVHQVHRVHRVQVRVLLAPSAFLEGALAQLPEEIAPQLAPCAEAVALAQTLPGVGETAEGALIAEVGTDMSRFPTQKHLASWAGVCPGTKQSGGKRLRSQTTHGTPWLRSILAEVAGAISHTTDT